MAKKFKPLFFRCHTPNLLKEILHNKDCYALRIPLNVFGKMLFEVAEHARELNDPKLNALMMRLTLYEQGDPELPGYDAKLYDQVVNHASAN